MERNQAERRQGSPLLANDRGLVLLKLGESSRAERSFREAVELDGDFADAWINLGRTAHLQGRPEEARKAALTALRLSPGAEKAAKLLHETASPPARTNR